MSLVNEFYKNREMITAAEVARRLGIHTNTLYNWIRNDVGIPYHEVPGFGRHYDWAEVQAWATAVKNYKAPPKPKTVSEERAEQSASVAELIAKTDKLLAALEAKEAA